MGGQRVAVVFEPVFEVAFEPVAEEEFANTSVVVALVQIVAVDNMAGWLALK